MEENKLIGQENEKLNTAILEGIHYKYEYHPLYKCKVIEFEIDDNCDQRVFDFIQSLYQSSKGSYFQFDAIQNEEQRKIIELLLANKPPINSNRPISSEIEIHQAMFSVKIKSKKNTLTDAQKIELIRYWKVPTLPNHFIGRQQLLEELTQRLDPKKVEIPAVVITACYGLGGIGKTFLAAQYAQTQRGNYTFILWFNAENNETLYRDYYDFATAIQLPIEKQSPENVIAMVKNWLENHPTWLIIYDNAPDDKLITKYRPAKGGKILITSRKESWSKKESLAIDVFNLEEARDYIVELTGYALAEHQATIDKLAKILGFLPLALAQACAYISVNHLSLEEYLSLYAESRVEMLADETMPTEASHEPVAVTWHITFEAIKKQQPAASALLESCAFLQGSSMPEFLLKELFAKQQPTLAKQMKPFIDVMRCLQQYSMLKLINQEKEKAFSLHNLVQEVIVDKLSTDKKQTYLLEIIELLKSIFPYQIVEQVEDYAKQRDLLPHMEKVLGRVENWLSDLKKDEAHKEFVKLQVPVIEREWYVPLLEFSAHGYSNVGDARQKKALLKRALVIKEQHYGKDHLEYVHTLGDLANAHGDLGNAQQQKQLLEQVLMIQEQHCEKDDPRVASTLGNLANAYGDLGDVHKQKELLEQALPIFRQHYGKDHPQMACILGNLANTYGVLGGAQQQKQLLEQVLVIQEQHYGKNHPKVALTLANLANAYEALGDARKQKKLLEQTLEIDEQHYGKDHPEVAATLNDLATAYGTLGDVRRQKELLERALVIKEQRYGKNHPQVARTLGNLANAYGALGDVQNEKQLLERALVIQEQHYGEDHPQVALILANLANAIGALGDARQKKAMLERVLVIQEKHYGKNHPKVAATLNNLSTAYEDLGDMHKQKELLEQALPIFEQHYGKDHFQVASILVNLAKAYGNLGKAREKKQLLKRALMLEEQHYGNDHPEVAATLNNLVSAYVSLDKWSKAKLVAERAYQIFSTHPNVGPQHPHTQASKRKLDAINKVLATFSSEQLSALQAHNKTSVTEKNNPDLAKALRNAANQNNVEKLKELLSQGVDVNVKDDGQHGRTALHWAVIKQAYPCIKLLLTTGADAMLVDKAGKSSLDYAGENSIPGALFLLLNHHYKLPLEDIDVGKLLRRAAHQNKVNDIKLLLKHIKNINEKDTGNTQRTALHWALIQGATDCIEVLLMAGADPHLADGQSKTAYDYAQDKPELLSLLPPITTQTYIL